MGLKIRRGEPLRKKVYRHLHDMILCGLLSPGERLVETAIAERLGVSRTPVREALRSLEADGWVEARPNLGYVVKAISEKEVGEICEIRVAIEGIAIKWAFERDRERLIKGLERNLALSERKLAKGDPKVFIDLDAQFHEIIARSSGSERLLEMAQMLRRHMLRYRIESIYVMDNVLRALEGHRAILKALKEGDLARAFEALKRHIEQSKEDILQYAFGQRVLAKGALKR